ncbi:DUF6443 domain-containing protein [Aquimarina brevivitae]|uniref:RHS repeat-associated protein n=1 Tax=Aquimarina brevivitae TaxID=323412 RepID=A0A4Q7P0S5_9FLAO|nr:DUF6443 domain-containing protein [Aquimarina brevivitae]RZS93147.1 RHS repeat-associated protein [Aquimarina brevivitae]
MKKLYIYLILCLPFVGWSQLMPPSGGDDCSDVDPNATRWYRDADGDGYHGLQSMCSVTKPNGYIAKGTFDCDDTDSSVKGLRTWYRDADGDGYGNSADSRKNCYPITGYVSNANDCNDNNPNINIDKVWYRDADGDGYGLSNNSITSCTQPSGYISIGGDCNDTNTAVNPGATEPCIKDNIDNNCNGQIDERSASTTTFSIVKNCGSTTIEKGAHNQSFETWYWQNSATGTSTTNASQSLTKTSDGTIYLRGRNNASGCWGPSKRINYTVNQKPGKPTATIDNQCGKTVLKRGTPPNGITWYWQSSSGGTSTANSAVAITRTTGNTYYLRARNNTSGCWSATTVLNYTIHQNPNMPSAPSVATNCGSTLLTRGNPPSGETWYWQSTSGGTSTTNSATSVTRTSGDTYYLRARNNSTQCWSPARSVSYQVHAIPNAPALNNITVVNNCGATILTRGPVLNTFTWYWQSTANGTSLANSSASITLTSGSSYYIRSRNNSTGCWSPATTINYTIDQAPDWYLDADGDGFAISKITQCTSPGQGYTTTALPLTDCNDSDAAIHPNTVWYLDTDQDNYAASTVVQCANPGIGYTIIVLPVTDCNDADPSLNPGTVWYADTDGDGFGDADQTLQQCTAPNGYVANAEDLCPAVAGSFEGCSARPYQAPVFSNENYVFTRAYQVPLTDSLDIQYNKDVVESISYFDGLGRAKQQIGIKATPDLRDIITHIEYDGFGRQDKQYLPFVRNSAPGSYQTVDVNTAIGAYYQDKYPEDFTTAMGITIAPNPYAESIFESSPLNRVVEQGAPGTAWMALPDSDLDNTIKFDWDTNNTEEVVYFKVGFTDGNTEAPELVQQGHYPAEELYVSITKDENWQPTDGDLRTTREYKDKQGRVILKRTFIDTPPLGETEGVDTYYVYDDYGNLTYVLPPKVNTDDGVSSNELNELCYQYKYDYRNRLIEKKIPGKGWEYIVYNKLDQPVLTQDANQRANNEWLFTKYDVLGRVAYTGIKSDDRDRLVLQDEINAFTGNLWVDRDVSQLIGGVAMYYNNGGYPNTLSAEVLTVNYYDDYEVGDIIVFNPANGAGTWEGMTATANAKGLPTVSQVKVLETETDNWITTATYYDNKGRAWETHLVNEYLGTEDWVLNKLDFAGKVLKTRSMHIKDGQTLVTVDTFEYDHMGRLLNQQQTINNQDTEQIVANTYDELGQLVSKNIGGQLSPSGGAGGGLQQVDYTYNIRGWLKGINDVTNLGNDLFGFGINYNDPQNGATALYNGNISETLWRTANDDIQRHYTYDYDALNRITAGTSSDNRYNLSNVSYDKMGNLLTLQRGGHINEAATSFGVMDDLTYSYYDGGNKLKAVAEASPEPFGFTKNATTGTDYTYDANGNMVTDNNKGITGISYNHLNLPTTVNVNTNAHNGNITYIYDATGAKLRKIATEGSAVTTTDYAGNYIYKNGNLEFFNTPEGYIEPTVTSSGVERYDYVYQFKDHLGNIRLSYADNDKDGKIDVLRNDADVDGDNDNAHEILEEKNYYPFGLQHKGYNDLIVSEHNYGFGGKEEQDELGLGWIDITARNYNPELGRWMNLDPLAEQMRRHSPYNYAFDNPIYFMDPDGMMPVSGGDDDVIKKVSNTKRAGNRVQRDVSVTVTLSVVAGPNDDLTKTMFSKKSGTISLSNFEGKASAYNVDADLLSNDNVTDFNIEYKVVSSLDDVGENDHVMMLVDEIPALTASGKDPVGKAELGGRVSAVERGTLSNGSFNEASQHELGHNLGYGPGHSKGGGLMGASINGNTALSKIDRGKMVGGEYGMLVHSQGDGTYKESNNGGTEYKTSIKTQAQKFIKKNKITQ